MSNKITICGWCRAEEDKEKGVILQACAGCKEVWYCGDTCQKKHWSRHKSNCSRKKGLKLIQAIDEGNMEKVKRIIKKNKRAVNARITYWHNPQKEWLVSWTPMHQTVVNRNMEAFNLLLQEGAKVDLADGYGQTPLGHAVSIGILRMVESLITMGTNINQRYKFGVVPLMSAADNGDLSILQALLRAGADPNSVDEYGESSLIFAALRGYDTIISALLDAGAEPIAGKYEKDHSTLGVAEQLASNIIDAPLLPGETEQERQGRFARSRALLVLAEKNMYRKSETGK